MNSFIYLRSLRVAEHTVFCVQNGQKYYYDVQFGRYLAYSSGQQVKRSIIDETLATLNEAPAKITFNYEINKDKLETKEPWSPCDPTYTDQLLGGWMKAESGAKALKRRSPFSFSAMRPLHPLLGGLESIKEDLTFDRSSNPDHHPVKVRMKEGNDFRELSEEEIKKFLDKHGRTLPRRNWIPEHSRATGLFVNDVAIDLRTLFCVSMNEHEPELTTETMGKLKEAGWVEGENVFGKCLICPAERREKLIPAVAKALLDWRITSNQSRTFSLMETLAVAVSDNANKIAGSIRAALKDNDNPEKPEATPVLDPSAGAELFIAPPASSRIAGAEVKADALELAEKSLVEKLRAFDYENQVTFSA